MAKRKKKLKVPKPRNTTYVLMREHTKPGAHTDQKKEKRRKQCRGKTTDAEA